MADRGRRTAAGVAASLTALLLAAPRPTAALALVRDAGAGTGDDPTGPVVAVVALLAWAATAWLALAVVVVLLSRAPGLLGHAGRAVSGRIAPATVRRAVEAALGLTVAVGALTPSAALATSVAAPAGAVTAGPSDGADWDLDWPTTSAAPSPAASRPAPTGPAAAPTPPAAPSAAPVLVVPRATPSAGTPPQARPPQAAPSDTPASLRPPETRSPAPAGTPAPVVVRPGDSLWALAESALRRAGTASPTDRQVAQAWPRWWAANRDAIGDDPDLLLPGTVLRPPPAAGPR